MNPNTKISYTNLDNEAEILEAARQIVRETQTGDAGECYDWLKNGSYEGGGVTLKSLYAEWIEYNNQQ